MSTLVPPTSSSPQQTALEREETKKTQYAAYGRPPGRRHFWLRRVHSLMGLLFGAYVTVHLLVNATGLWPRDYQMNVDHIHALEPMLWMIELVAIFIPLLVHALYGVYITWAGVKFNTTKYNYGGNVRYTLQRWAGVVLLLFIAYHIATMHKWGLASLGVEGYPKFNGQNVAYQSTAAAIKTPYSADPRHPANLAVVAFYLLGTWAAVFHWANGLWTSAIAWGLTVTAGAQKRWGHFCFGFGLVMLVIGTTAWFAFGVIGKPTLDVSATWTLPHETSKAVHGQASGGQETKHPHDVGEVPTTNKD